MGLATSVQGWRQFGRYVVVGLVSNGVLYLLYLALTSMGLSPALAMTVSYGSGVVQTFALNRAWTFTSTLTGAAGFGRYVMTYATGYLVNLLLLFLLVDQMQLPHAQVQGALILCVAVVIYLLQKHWVFRRR